MAESVFEWDPRKNGLNIEKHGVSFFEAQRAFLDPHRVIAQDIGHSTKTEMRYYCFGEVDGAVMTVRFIPKLLQNLAKGRVQSAENRRS